MKLNIKRITCDKCGIHHDYEDCKEERPDWDRRAQPKGWYDGPSDLDLCPICTEGYLKIVADCNKLKLTFWKEV